MAETLINQEDKENDNSKDANSLDIAPAKVSLFLESMAESCQCPNHLYKDKKTTARNTFDTSFNQKKVDGAFVSFIKSSSLSPRLRNLL